MKMEILSLGIFGFCMGLDLVGLRVVRNERSAGYRNGRKGALPGPISSILNTKFFPFALLRASKRRS
jgi:hypothetical protein